MRTSPVTNLAALATLFIAGCGKSEPTANTTTKPIPTTTTITEDELETIRLKHMQQKVKVMMNELSNFSMAYYLNEELKIEEKKIDIQVSNEREKTDIEDVLQVLKRIGKISLANNIKIVESTDQPREDSKVYSFVDLYTAGQELLKNDHDRKLFWSNRITRNKMAESQVHELYKPAG